MAITVGSNIAASQAQRRLSESTSGLTKTFERLSSGLRINRAADDAAGLAISESLKADSRVVSQAVRNLNDGVSLLSIADATVESLTNIVIRLKELATQSANGVYGASQRVALDKEAQKLSQEYTRIAQSAKFNGLDLFTGSLGNVRLQGGFGSDGGIVSGLGGAVGNASFQASITQNLSSAANLVFSVDVNSDGKLDLVSNVSGGGAFKVSRGNGDGTFVAAVSYAIGTAPVIVLDDFNGDGYADVAAKDGTVMRLALGNGDGTFAAGVTFTTGSLLNDELLSGDVNNDGKKDLVLTRSVAGVFVFLGNGNGTFRSAIQTSDGDGSQATLADFNGDGLLDIVQQGSSSTLYTHLGNGDGTFKAAASLVSAAFANDVVALDVNGDGILDLATADQTTGYSIFIGNGDGSFRAKTVYALNSANKFTLGDFNGDGLMDLAAAGGTTSKITILLSNGNGSFQQSNVALSGTINYAGTGDYNADGVADLAYVNSASELVALTANTVDGISAISPFDLKSSYSSKQAFLIFDNALEILTKQRGKIGAFQSRLASATITLQTTNENLLTANSRITDADLADESARLVKGGILQEAATAILAQANAQPGIALKLLNAE